MPAGRCMPPETLVVWQTKADNARGLWLPRAGDRGYRVAAFQCDHHQTGRPLLTTRIDSGRNA